MTPIVLYDLNDLSLSVPLDTIDATSGRKTPLTSGTVTAFLATSNASTATAADASLVASVNYSGRSNLWTLTFDGAVLLPALLADLFASTPPVLIIQKAGDIRVYVELVYGGPKPATVA